ncbi:MAG TPA: TetR/AcrR family transcriptional regulator [Verrucomicrobiales bacterium]|nr:TetR/AcrR family transcriptional regulator [Verrucomicrobiales bacterium]
MPAPSQARDPSTRLRLLEAAEVLFASHGFDSVSLRLLTRQAKANLASVHYHFGSKEALIDAVIARYVSPINHQRLALLDNEERLAGPSGFVPLRPLVLAFIGPVFSMIRQSELSEKLFFKLMGRFMSDRGYRLPESVTPLFQEVSRRFSLALQRSLPALPEHLILWRLHFTFGVFAHTFSHREALAQVTGGRAGNPSAEEILQHAADYCVAGLQAPVSIPEL